MTRRTAEFFFEHAGYSYNPEIEGAIAGRVRGALELAYADRFARLQGFTFAWDRDGSTSAEFSDAEPAYPLWGCTMHDTEGNVYDTLGGVDFGPGDYSAANCAHRWVCEAEMALQNLSRMRDESLELPLPQSVTRNWEQS